MNKKRFIFLALIIFVLLFISSSMFHIRFSANASCRALAMNTKGYAVWEYQSTTQEDSKTHVSFLDIYDNSLTCTATRIGPFWLVTSYTRIHAHCVASANNQFDPCPEDYFGVNP